jgi:uncharacterized OB-fold protein
VITELTRRLRRWRQGTVVIDECRNCGTTLGEHLDSCPACGADEIARYEVTE